MLQEHPSSQCLGKLRHSEIQFSLDKTEISIQDVFPHQEFDRGRAGSHEGVVRIGETDLLGSFLDSEKPKLRVAQMTTT